MLCRDRRRAEPQTLFPIQERVDQDRFGSNHEPR